MAKAKMNNLPEDIQTLFIEAPLYLEYNILGRPQETVERIQYFQGTIDAYCLECKQSSIFEAVIVHPADYSGRGIPPAFAPPPRPPEEKIYTHPDRIFAVQFKCTRIQEHRIWFFFRIWDNKLIKVGQHPSLADFESKGLDKYKRLLSKDEQVEFTKAIGLYAHGIGVGSYVYLRRIFEHLVEQAHQKAQKQSDWNEEIYGRSHMDEKIKMLESYLPKTLVSEANIYSILSKGLHELTEDECKLYFPVVKSGIEIILDEEIEKRE